ncbi:PAS domain S-box-containing protein [Methanocalculus alkaliphilus]|uniref:PAS domain S-box protein n=1 Tax=Methanocalculus alkaliphilus TaxID=768730 RepID=UPI00209E2E56|nr:PAS domain S-box protein [Methanocalculus alkaliphilus]MCP1715502.1 PAS domain S-box-containing protein [Methanocalculus alkaliphilus]
MKEQPVRIIYVDDEPPLLEIGKIFLERTGEIQVTVAGSPEEGIQLLATGSFDAIVSDYQMPGCDGIAFLKYIRSRNRSTPFIIFTGKGREDVVIEALNEGADFYLQKGGDPKSQFAELSNKILYAVRQRRADREVRTAGERYKALIAVSNTGAWEFSYDTGFLWCSPEYFAMLGRDSRDFDLSGNPNLEEVWIDLIHPEDGKRAADHFRRFLAGNNSGMYENDFRMRHADGHWVWIWSRGWRLRDEQGELTNITIGTHINVTDRKASEEEARAAYEQLAASEEELRSRLDENSAIQRDCALSEERYRAIFEYTEAPTVILEEDTTVSLANSAFLDIYGYSFDEVVGRSWTEFVSRSDLDRMNAYHQQRREEGGAPPKQYEFTFISRYGQAHAVHLTVGMIPGTRQSVASFHDITDLKKAEAALRASEEQYRDFFEKANLLIQSVDDTGRFVFVNQTWKEKFGYTDEDLRSLTLFDIIHPDSLNHCQATFQRVIAGEAVENVQAIFLTKSRRPVFVEGNVSCRHSDGEIHTRGIFHDITGRRLAEERLRRSEERLKTILTNTPAVVYSYTVDKDGVPDIVFINDTVNDILGYAPEDFIGNMEFWAACVHPDDMQDLMAVPARLRDSPPVAVTYRFRDAAGNWHWLLDTQIVSRKNDAELEVNGAWIDITERKEMEDELKLYRERLSQAQIFARAGTWDYDIGSSRLYWSPECEALFGLEEGAFEGTFEAFLDCIHPDDREYVIETNKPITDLKEGIPLEYEHRIQTKTGEILWVRESAGVIRDQDGRPVRIAGFVMDITGRKETENALSDSERRFRTLFENMNAGFVLFEVVEDETGDPVDLRILAANNRFAATTGLTMEKVAGRLLTEVLPGIERDRAGWIEKYGSVGQNGIPLQFEEGSELLGSDFEISAYQAGPKLCAVTFTDITQRKAAEAALRESEDRYSRAIERTGAGLWDWDMINDRVFYSKQWKRMLGYEDHEIENTFTGWMNLWHPDETARIMKAVSDHQEGRANTYQVEHRLRHKDGSWRWILTRGDVQRDADGRPVRWTGTNIDITEQKKQAEELESFFNVNLDLLCIADLEGNFIKTNPAWSSSIGYTTEELNRRKFLDFVHPDDMQATLDAIADLGRGEEVLNFTNRYLCKDGSYRYIEWRSHPKGTLIYAAARDITERITYEEALHTANRKLQLLSSITRHDILNQVMVSQGFLEFAGEMSVDPVQARYLDEVKKATTAIQRQIEFTRIYEEVGVKKAAWHTIDDLIMAIPESDLPLHAVCGRHQVLADPMIVKVLYNLMENTIRYAEGATAITITCTPREASLLITWEDDGPGIPDDQKEEIFKKGVGRNTGFGLFLAREILAITGISIIETGVYGEGARFEIRVPAGAWRGGPA